MLPAQLRAQAIMLFANSVLLLWGLAAAQVSAYVVPFLHIHLP